MKGLKTLMLAALVSGCSDYGTSRLTVVHPDDAADAHDGQWTIIKEPAGSGERKAAEDPPPP